MGGEEFREALGTTKEMRASGLSKNLFSKSLLTKSGILMGVIVVIPSMQSPIAPYAIVAPLP